MWVETLLCLIACASGDKAPWYALFFLGSGGKQWGNQVNQLVSYCSSKGRSRQDYEESSAGETWRLSGSCLTMILWEERPSVPYLENVLSASGDNNWAYELEKIIKVKMLFKRWALGGPRSRGLVWWGLVSCCLRTVWNSERQKSHRGGRKGDLSHSTVNPSLWERHPPLPGGLCLPIVSS